MNMNMLELCALKNNTMHFLFDNKILFSHIIFISIFHCLNVACDVASVEKSC